MSDDVGIEPRPQVVARRSVKDVIFGFGTFAASLAFALVVIPLGVVSPGSVTHLPLSPVFLPYVLTALVGLFGLICGLQALLGPGVPKEAGEDEFALRRSWVLHLLLIGAALTAYYLLPEAIGMLLTAVLVTGFLVWLGGERRILMILGVALLLPVAVYLFFTWVAQVPLPEGYFEGWI